MLEYGCCCDSMQLSLGVQGKYNCRHGTPRGRLNHMLHQKKIMGKSACGVLYCYDINEGKYATGDDL